MVSCPRTRAIAYNKLGSGSHALATCHEFDHDNGKGCSDDDIVIDDGSETSLVTPVSVGVLYADPRLASLPVPLTILKRCENTDNNFAISEKGDDCERGKPSAGQLREKY